MQDYPANGLKADFEIAAALEPRPGAATLAPPPGCKIKVTEGPDGKFYIPAADTTTPCNVTLDIYGEEFNFKASRYEARRLIAAFERVLAARRSVRRLQGELDAARAQSFDGVSIGAGAGIVVDDPDAGGQTEAA